MPFLARYPFARIRVLLALLQPQALLVQLAIVRVQIVIQPMGPFHGGITFVDARNLWRHNLCLNTRKSTRIAVCTSAKTLPLGGAFLYLQKVAILPWLLCSKPSAANDKNYGGHDHENGRNAKGEGVARVLVQAWLRSQQRHHDGGEQSAGVDGRVEDGEEHGNHALLMRCELVTAK